MHKHTHKFDPSEVRKLENPERFKWLNPMAVADLFKVSGDEVLVEYGCGTGFYTIELARRVPRGRMIALDISTELLDYFRSKLSRMEEDGQDLPANIDLLLIDGLPSPVPTGTVDAILAINLLHELEGEWEVLADMHRMLAHDGKMIVLDWLAMQRPAGPPIDHCLDPDRAIELLDQAGFELLERPLGASETFPYHFTYIMGKKQ